MSDNKHAKGNLSISTGLFTSTGPKDRNEDALGVHIPDASLIRTKGIVACIADGVSAATSGKEAAESAVIGFITDYFETPEPWSTKTAGERVLTALNRWLYAQGSQIRNIEKGWLTTFTAIILKSRSAHIFHIGDSRLYRIRSEKIEAITQDHSIKISADTNYLTRAMGLELSPQIDYHTIPLEPKDRLILTTDGIHEFINKSHLREILVGTQNSQQCADALGAATENSNDNRSCIVIDINDLPDGNIDDAFRELNALPFPPDLLPGQKIDGLQVERLISASRHSQLYEVVDEVDGKSYILKAPSVTFENDPAYLERFILEEWIGLRTDHPNLAKAVRRNHQKRFLYYLMEPVQGIPLGTWCEQKSRPAIEEVIAITGQIVAGVRALHRKDTLHQDLKPDNIMIDEKGVIKIIDYGSCRVGGIEEISAPYDRGSALGTLDFSAPEYRLGSKATTRSDLFSIAAITYHLLTRGHHPYGRAWELARTARDFYDLKYEPAVAHHPMVPLWMDAVLRKALSVQPEHRQDSMSSFYQNLQHPDREYLTAEPLPFAQRNPLLFWKLLAFAALTGWLITWFLMS
ncbi:bifunctional protein-serine/threonine kinase/phosphatase [Luteolibacter pohnpeiensis]|uniref:Bifunctional protein-serine/threonine kinase/phosphatase n=1 Tax=Luteolibacter pohnpeiensis TaxID=454153 RepID=A0A934S9G4_9BACT|nr:bifunctional protein-serine/threonine kinase/phosphatase [Luteolibacter pohnpeiensis]MBK1883815.1 bifunctional protein-serine/threonine kinase/phosphatase [Luteolibacter pohnpeiensis]